MGFNIIAPYMVCVTHKWISPSLISFPHSQECDGSDFLIHGKKIQSKHFILSLLLRRGSIGGTSTALQFSKWSFFILQPVQVLFYILQAHLFSNFTAKTLVIFHSTFSWKNLFPALCFTYKPPLLTLVQTKERWIKSKSGSFNSAISDKTSELLSNQYSIYKRPDLGLDFCIFSINFNEVERWSIELSSIEPDPSINSMMPHCKKSITNHGD